MGTFRVLDLSSSTHTPIYTPAPEWTWFFTQSRTCFPYLWVQGLRVPAADVHYHYHLLHHVLCQELYEACEKKAHGKSHWERFHDQCHTGGVLISCRCMHQASLPHSTISVITIDYNAMSSYTNVFPDARSFEAFGSNTTIIARIPVHPRGNVKA